jgi:ribosome-associated protein
LLIQITKTLFIDDNDIQLDFILSSGPGGQNVNKVCTAVQLRFNVDQSKALSDEMRHRLIKIAGNKMTEDGILVIKARRFRSQDKNRKDAFQRLADLIRRAAVRPKARRRTKPSPAARQRRLTTKKKRGEIKRQRRSVKLPHEP